MGPSLSVSHYVRATPVHTVLLFSKKNTVFFRLSEGGALPTLAHGSKWIYESIF